MSRQICRRRRSTPIGSMISHKAYSSMDRLESLLNARAACRTCLLPFSWRCFGGLQMRGQKRLRVDHFGLSDIYFCRLTANISKTVSRSVTCQLELNISSTRAFYFKRRPKSRGGSSPGESIISKTCCILSIFGAASVISARTTDAWVSTRVDLC